MATDETDDRQAADEVPAAVRDFVPEHCPHRSCPAHRPSKSVAFRFHRRGYRRIDRDPGWVRVFRCLHCQRYFCDAAFSEDYWRKRRGVIASAFVLLANGQAQRQVARSLHVAPNTIARIERHLARQCLLHHIRQVLELVRRLREGVVLDGLRTFAGSQYEPVDLNVIVTALSGYVLDVAAVPLRRSGTMTPRQKRIREQRERLLGVPEPRIRLKVTAAALERVAGFLAPGLTLELDTDEEPDYARAVASLAGRVSIHHRTTSSRRRRDADNPLWPVNHLDRLARHSLKSHTRETIAFHKCLRGLMDRALIFRTWVNQSKGYSERTAETARITPAMRLGLAERLVREEELFAKRLFPGHFDLSDSDRELYEGRIKARPREVRAVHIPTFAY